MSIKKIILLTILTGILTLLSFFSYTFFKVERNNYIHSLSYISGESIAASNIYFFRRINVEFEKFFDFEKINEDILKDYWDQKICQGIFSDKIFKIPMTVVPFKTAGYTKVTFEITSDKLEIGNNCIKDIHEYVLMENNKAENLLNDLLEYGIESNNPDGSINYELREKLNKASSEILFFKKVNESFYKTEPKKRAILLNLFIISLIISISIVYLRKIKEFLKKLSLELKK